MESVIPLGKKTVETTNYLGVLIGNFWILARQVNSGIDYSFSYATFLSEDTYTAAFADPDTVLNWKLTVSELSGLGSDLVTILSRFSSFDEIY